MEFEGFREVAVITKSGTWRYRLGNEKFQKLAMKVRSLRTYVYMPTYIHPYNPYMLYMFGYLFSSCSSFYLASCLIFTCWSIDLFDLFLFVFVEYLVSAG